MTHQVRWHQPRDGGVTEQTHDFEDLDGAKEFAQGLGSDARAQIFDMDKAEQPVWTADESQATDKERQGARAANVVGQSEGLGPNTKPDTRDDKPEDLRKVMGNAPKGPGQLADLPGEAESANPEGSRKLDADQGQRKPQDGSNNRGLSQDGL